MTEQTERRTRGEQTDGSGQPSRLTITLTPEQSATRAAVQAVEVVVVTAEPPETETCPECSGDGWRRIDHGRGRYNTNCPICKGTGQVCLAQVRERCPRCGGGGRTERPIPGVPPRVCVASSPCDECWPKGADGERLFWNDGTAGWHTWEQPVTVVRTLVVTNKNTGEPDPGDGPYIVTYGDGVRGIVTPPAAIADFSITDEPWAADLSPGQSVWWLRLEAQ